ncbi:X-box-binding protein 1 [Neocloeon triangulifer]|uniref:X-box-binding protein 1 n=1 Tax=Neocloeon triangulifer TaxID=2078957 RepID=UPI00286EC599|nr:X-box-binding protein 1 [Neocloeon triangulifer]
MAAKTILIALPCGPREKLPLPPRVPAFSRTIERIKVEPADDEGCQRIVRKRKIDCLSIEEKILRKKMKNRVAAQTSRDKKKAKMDELEQQLAEARAQIEQLRAENAALRLGGCTRCGEEVSSRGPQDFVPAVSKPELPLQKGRGPRLETPSLAWCSAWALLLLLMARNLQSPKTPAAEEVPREPPLDRRVVRDLRAERLKWWGCHQNSWNPMKIRP